MTLIAPSLLSADFARLGEQVRLAEEGGADWIHLDIMDGHFVPNISFGPAVVKAVRALTQLPLDTHLMVSDPDAWVGPFAKAGSDRITLHVEACPDPVRTLSAIRDAGALPGITLRPATPMESIAPLVPRADLLLVMSVNPGFGGQSFLPGSLERIAAAAAMIRADGRGIPLEVDGGVDASNAAAVVRAGANVLVAGNAVFGARDVPGAVRRIRSAAGG